MPKRLAVGAVAIAMQPLGRGVVRECLDDLLGRPLGCRMLRDVEMHDAATDVRQHDNYEEHATRKSRHGEKIHRRGGCKVIREKRFPRLRRPTCLRFQQTRDGALRHVDAERQQFAVNPRSAPQRVRRRHLAHKGSDLLINGWTAMMALQRAARPTAAKPVTMPADDGVRWHDHQRLAPVLPTSREYYPRESVACPEAASRRSMQGCQLLPQREAFQDKFPVTAQRPGQGAG